MADRLPSVRRVGIVTVCASIGVDAPDGPVLLEQHRHAAWCEEELDGKRVAHAVWHPGRQALFLILDGSLDIGSRAPCNFLRRERRSLRARGISVLRELASE